METGYIYKGELLPKKRLEKLLGKGNGYFRCWEAKVGKAVIQQCLNEDRLQDLPMYIAVKFGYDKQTLMNMYPKLTQNAVTQLASLYEDEQEFLQECSFRNKYADFVRKMTGMYNVTATHLYRLLKDYTEDMVEMSCQYNVNILCTRYLVTYEGVEVPLKYACEKIGISYGKLRGTYQSSGRLQAESMLYRETEDTLSTDKPAWSVVVGDAVLYASDIAKRCGVSKNTVSTWKYKYDEDTIVCAVQKCVTPYVVLSQFEYKGIWYSNKSLSLFLKRSKTFIDKVLTVLTRAEVQYFLDIDDLDSILYARRASIVIDGRFWLLTDLAHFISKCLQSTDAESVLKVCAEEGYYERLKFEAISKDVKKPCDGLWEYKCPVCGRTILCETEHLIDFKHDEDYCREYCVDEEASNGEAF